VRVALLIEINRESHKGLSHSSRLARGLTRKKMRRSLSYMCPQASRIFEKAGQLAHFLMRSSHQLHSSLPPLQKQHIAPAIRCVLHGFRTNLLLTIFSGRPAFHR
jgi:hypothetical protein